MNSSEQLFEEESSRGREGEFEVVHSEDFERRARLLRSRLTSEQNSDETQRIIANVN